MIDFKIIDITEEPELDRIIVKVETPYKIYDWKFPLNNKFINIQTNKPEFLHKVKERLEKKFKKSQKPKTSMKEWLGDYNTKDIEDLSPAGLHKEVLKKRKLKETQADVTIDLTKNE